MTLELPAGDVGLVLSGQDAMSSFLSDWSKTRAGQARCVVLPDTTEQVANLMRWCHEHQVPVVPQGGNTGLVGGATPDASGRAIVLSLSRLNRVRKIDPSNNSLT